MTNEEKQLKLEKNSTILQAALDYHLKFYTGSFVLDDYDPSVDYYLREKEQTAKDFQEGNLDAIQQRLKPLLENIVMRRDLNFEGYIKAQTGYDLDLLIEQEDTEPPTEPVLPEGERVVVEVLVLPPPPPSTESSVIVETEGTIRSLTEAEFAEFKRQNGVLAETCAPDGIRRIIIQTNGAGERALTSVSIALMGGAGGIYTALGASLPIKAYWRDNDTVIIETKEEYQVVMKCHTVRSHDDVVKIEYIEPSGTGTEN